MTENTLFLRFEGPLQAWGVHESKFIVRRCAEAPGKSGVIGLLCAAMGVDRITAEKGGYLERLNELQMGVRIDRPGIRWWDYHTVGAEIGSETAEGKIKITQKTGEIETFVSRREYLCDASFLIVLQGDGELVAELAHWVQHPVWTPYLGRKSCPISRPLLERAPGNFDSITDALRSVPWSKRYRGERPPKELIIFQEWRAVRKNQRMPADAEIWYDIPVSFDPPFHNPRVVVRHTTEIGRGGVSPHEQPLQNEPSSPPRPRADYTNTRYRKVRAERMAKKDHHLCVFCKSPADTVQHITYKDAGGDEKIEQLRSLCRLCHDAVTMIEYGLQMGLDRINPEEECWREEILKNREEIIAFRSRLMKRRLMEKVAATSDRKGKKSEERNQ